MSLKYAYCRISTTDQNIDRQIIAVKTICTRYIR